MAADDSPHIVTPTVEEPEMASFTGQDDQVISLDAFTTKKKKKRGRKGAAARGTTALPSNRGTGFEEFFADPPMTPAEAKEEKEDIYSDDYPFELRIVSCIQRFRARRRLQHDNNRFFNEYLFLGGIDCNPSQFGGMDPKELKELTPSERREITATDVISGTGERFYNGDREHWSVDFTGVAAGFCSTSLMALTDLSMPSVTKAVSVVESFLRYVLQHDVCPEYEDDIKGALEVCAKAMVEWPDLMTLEYKLPGAFNWAANGLFGDTKDYGEDDERSEEEKQLEKDAEKVIFFASLAMSEPAIFASLSKGEHEVAREFTCTVQVASIHRPEADIVDQVKRLQIGDKPLPILSAIGKATFTQTIIESDMIERKGDNPFAEDKLTLYFEDVHLALLKPGMRMRLEVCELDTGFCFAKRLYDAVPSFYKFLPQELMRFYKPPQENERLPPSAANPEGEAQEEEDEE